MYFITLVGAFYYLVSSGWLFAFPGGPGRAFLAFYIVAWALRWAVFMIRRRPLQREIGELAVYYEDAFGDLPAGRQYLQKVTGDASEAGAFAGAAYKAWSKKFTQDPVGQAIGAGVMFLSKKLKDVGKSEDQLAIEAAIQERVNAIGKSEAMRELCNLVLALVVVFTALMLI